MIHFYFIIISHFIFVPQHCDANTVREHARVNNRVWNDNNGVWIDINGVWIDNSGVVNWQQWSVKRQQWCGWYQPHVWMSPECSLKVPWKFPEISLKVPWKFSYSWQVGILVVGETRIARNAKKITPDSDCENISEGMHFLGRYTHTQFHLMTVRAQPQFIIMMEALCGTCGNMWWTWRSTPGIRRLVMLSLDIRTHTT